MKLILAQGNPEARFDGTRHNIGFALIDAFAEANGAEWLDKPKFHTQLAELTIDDEKILLAKPTTYYNETGIAARALKDFYKIDDILVIHDDIALPFGAIRIRSKGSDAGNNGIKSLNAHLGENFRRLRIGMWNEQRNQIDDVAFVLGKLNSDERAAFGALSSATTKLIDEFIHGDLHDTSITLEK